MNTVRALRLAVCLVALPWAACQTGSDEQRPDTASGPYRILVTNDDGLDSPALAALVVELSRLGEVTVCAPDGNRSGSSHSVSSLKGPLLAEPRQIDGATAAYAVSGTPADAVHLAVVAIESRPFDLVISGINRGANVGNIAHYSGTVGAAMEGALFGIPSIAISQEKGADSALSARFAATFVQQLRQHGARPGVVYSINVPAQASERRHAAAGRMDGAFFEVTSYQESERGSARAFEAVTKSNNTAPAGSDTALYLAGNISVTPLRIDWTHEAALRDLASWNLPVK